MLAYAHSWGIMIVHKQAFYMGTCVEGGDSAQPFPWRANSSNSQRHTNCADSMHVRDDVQLARVVPNHL